jgi:hypothetical protein
MAQVSGLYRTCECMTSNWAWGGGYLDFSQQDTSSSYWIAWCWASGTCLTGTVMGLSMFYITVEWCQQSFLSTEDYQDAMKGLRMTRTYRSWTLFARHASRATLTQLEKLAVALHIIKKRRSTLLWTRDHTWNPVIPGTDSPLGREHGQATPSIELTDYNDRRTSATPAMAHSLFPPVITPRRTRNESDASVDPFDVSRRLRISDDSSRPLVQRPSQVHRQHETENLMSGDGRNSLETPSLEQEPTRTSAPTWLHTQDAVQNRQGYHRANSDPGLSHESGDAEQIGLGILPEPPNHRHG